MSDGHLQEVKNNNNIMENFNPATLTGDGCLQEAQAIVISQHFCILEEWSIRGDGRFDCIKM